MHVRLSILLTVTCFLAHAAEAEELALSTDDTVLGIQTKNDQLMIASLHQPQTTNEWIAPVKGIPLIATIVVDGKSLPLHWHFKETRDKTSLIFVNDEPALELQSIWVAHPGPGPVEHTIRISNRSQLTVLLPAQQTLIFDAHVATGHTKQVTWISKGSGTPAPDGTHVDTIRPGYSANLYSTPYAENYHDVIPWVSVQDVDGIQGWYAGIEFSGRVLINLSAQTSDALHVELGLDAREPFQTRLAPGETFETPTVFIGCYSGSVDDGSNRLRRWVESNLRPAIHDKRYPLLVSNSWGSGMAVDEKLAFKMIDDAAALGLELYHIDAGWFRGVGDWHTDPKKFPQGLGPIADYAHGKGLKFGLWVGWTQGGHLQDESGKGTILSVFDQNMKGWFTQDYQKGWKTQEFTGADVCLGDPRAVAWCTSALREIVKAGKLDMLEHDQRMVVQSCRRADHQHTSSPTDVSCRAARGYYQVYDTIRAENPDLLFENCVNGGRMVDFGALRRAHYFSITDTYDPLSNRRAFYDAVYALPPSMCECYIENHPGKTIANFLYMLRSGMMGWCTMMLDMSHWSPTQRAAARRQFEIYKTTLRPLICDGNVYHVSERPDGVRWDGMQYVDSKRNSGVLFVFRGKTDDKSHTIKLKGLDPAVSYAITSEDNAVASRAVSGRELMESGLVVELAEPESSELVFLQASPNK